MKNEPTASIHIDERQGIAIAETYRERVVSPEILKAEAREPKVQAIKTSLLVLACVGLASLASAQVPIVIGPNSLLVWEMPGIPANAANACTYAVSVGSGPLTPIVGQVTCSAPVAPATAPLCSVNLIAQTVITVGAGSVSMVATCGGQTSLPSVPFQYLDLVVPVPQNVHFK